MRLKKDAAPIDPFIREQVRAYLLTGFNIDQASERFGIKADTIYKWKDRGKWLVPHLEVKKNASERVKPVQNALSIVSKTMVETTNGNWSKLIGVASNGALRAVQAVDFDEVGKNVIDAQGLNALIDASMKIHGISNRPKEGPSSTSIVNLNMLFQAPGANEDDASDVLEIEAAEVE